MKVKDLLNRKTKWTKNFIAKTKNNRPTTSRSADAVKWCLYGAVMKCYGPKSSLKACSKLERALQLLYPNKHSVVAFNDNRKTTFKDIRKLLKEANI